MQYKYLIFEITHKKIFNNFVLFFFFTVNNVHEQCPNSNPNSDLNSALHQAACPMSRPHFDVATSRQPESCRDIKSVSRHHSGIPRSRPQNGVTTPFLLPSPKPGRTLCRDINFMSRPHWRQTYVETSTSCRDLLHCRPCRDIKSMSRHPTLLPMSRPQNDVATSNQLSPIFATSRHPFSMSRPPLQPPMSRPQNDVATCNPTCCNSARSRRQFLVATSRSTRLGRDLITQQLFFFFFSATP